MRKRSSFIHTFKLKQLWSRLLQFGHFSWLSVKQGAPQQDQYIYVSNHMSYLDIVHMYRVAKRPFIFMGKASLLRWPLFGAFFRYMDVPVNRESKISSARALLSIKKYVQEGWSIAIFPEGTISKSAPVMVDFKDGAFQLAIETGVKIRPITWLNNHRLLSDPSDFLGPAHPGIIRAIVHDPIDPTVFGNDYLSLSRYVREVIEKPLMDTYPNEYGNKRYND